MLSSMLSLTNLVCLGRYFTSDAHGCSGHRLRLEKVGPRLDLGQSSGSDGVVRWWPQPCQKHVWFPPLASTRPLTRGDRPTDLRHTKALGQEAGTVLLKM